MNRRQRRALYADALGWIPEPFTRRDYDQAIKAAGFGGPLDGPDYKRLCRRNRRAWRRTRTPGARARVRRLTKQREMQARRKRERAQDWL